jgi:hypothetical protein
MCEWPIFFVDHSGEVVYVDYTSKRERLYLLPDDVCFVAREYITNSGRRVFCFYIVRGDRLEEMQAESWDEAKAVLALLGFGPGDEIYEMVSNEYGALVAHMEEMAGK